MLQAPYVDTLWSREATFHPCGSKDCVTSPKKLWGRVGRCKVHRSQKTAILRVVQFDAHHRIQVDQYALVLTCAIK